MDENPYQSPTVESILAPPAVDTPAVGIRSGRREDLRRVAACHRGLQAVEALYLLAMVVFPAFAFVGPFWVLAAALLVTIAAAALTVRTTLLFYGVGWAVVLGILAAVPGVGFLVLGFTEERAAVVLKKNGIKIGFFATHVPDA